jgi:hypothetical protein
MPDVYGVTRFLISAHAGDLNGTIELSRRHRSIGSVGEQPPGAARPLRGSKTTEILRDSRAVCEYTP